MTSGYDPYVEGQWNADIAHILPRHVGSRLLTSLEGETFWRPACDVFETNDEVVIHCDLPGVPREEIRIDIRDRELYITGQHQPGYETATSRIRERKVGKFRKIIRLPEEVITDVDISGPPAEGSSTTTSGGGGVKATYRDGLLEIRLPKVPEKRGKRITISG